MRRPDPSEHAPYYRPYIDLVPEVDILAAMESQRAEFAAFLKGVPDDAGPIKHPPYTWSVNQVLDHIIDSERIFAYRALRFARGDSTPLPGFDEQIFAREAQSDRCRVRDLAAELDLARRSSIAMFRRVPENAWTREGVANNNRVTVRALAWVIVGHARHHLNILKKRLMTAAGGV